jgi:hypothetical protein
VEAATRTGLPGVRALGLLGHETLLVYVLHLYILFGGIATGTPILLGLHDRLGLGGALLVLALMLPVLLAAAWLWRTAKQRAPREARLILVFVTTWVVWEFLTRPW